MISKQASRQCFSLFLNARQNNGFNFTTGCCLDSLLFGIVLFFKEKHAKRHFSSLIFVTEAHVKVKTVSFSCPSCCLIMFSSREVCVYTFSLKTCARFHHIKIWSLKKLLIINVNTIVEKKSYARCYIHKNQRANDHACRPLKTP